MESYTFLPDSAWRPIKALHHESPRLCLILVSDNVRLLFLTPISMKISAEISKQAFSAQKIRRCPDSLSKCLDNIAKHVLRAQQCAYRLLHDHWKALELRWSCGTGLHVQALLLLIYSMQKTFVCFFPKIKDKFYQFFFILSWWHELFPLSWNFLLHAIYRDLVHVVRRCSSVSFQMFYTYLWIAVNDKIHSRTICI